MEVEDVGSLTGKKAAQSGDGHQVEGPAGIETDDAFRVVVGRMIPLRPEGGDDRVGHPFTYRQRKLQRYGLGICDADEVQNLHGGFTGLVEIDPSIPARFLHPPSLRKR